MDPSLGDWGNGAGRLVQGRWRVVVAVGLQPIVATLLGFFCVHALQDLLKAMFQQQFYAYINGCPAAAPRQWATNSGPAHMRRWTTSQVTAATAPPTHLCCATHNSVFHNLEFFRERWQVPSIIEQQTQALLGITGRFESGYYGCSSGWCAGWQHDCCTRCMHLWHGVDSHGQLHA